MLNHYISQKEEFLSNDLTWFNTTFNYQSQSLDYLPDLLTVDNFGFKQDFQTMNDFFFYEDASSGSESSNVSPALDCLRSPSPCLHTDYYPSPSPSPKMEKRVRRKVEVEKTFPCDFKGCGKVFGRQEHVKRHIRSIHTKEKPFVCPYSRCQKKFARSDNLNQHIRTHRKAN
ncbi:hypothetical protein G6F56_013242 [Rhizopus delemar]|nr:hypothetical protein G6F56_013242 [Rhizopus delemar]